MGECFMCHANFAPLFTPPEYFPPFRSSLDFEFAGLLALPDVREGGAALTASFVQCSLGEAVSLVGYARIQYGCDSMPLIRGRVGVQPALPKDSPIGA